MRVTASILALQHDGQRAEVILPTSNRLRRASHGAIDRLLRNVCCAQDCPGGNIDRMTLRP